MSFQCGAESILYFKARILIVSHLVIFNCPLKLYFTVLTPSINQLQFIYYFIVFYFKINFVMDNFKIFYV